MIAAVIFDLDGVIVHTDELHYKAWQVVAKREGIYFDRTINNRLRGISRAESFEIILERATKSYTEAEKQALITEKNKIYLTYIETLTPNHLASDVLTLLNELKAQNIKLAIGSSSKNAKTILTRLGIVNYFLVISDGHNLINAKPHPEIFLKATAALNVNPQSCLVVEDAAAGIKAARAGGFISVGIGEAFHDKSADYRIKNISELLNIINKANA